MEQLGVVAVAAVAVAAAAVLGVWLWSLSLAPAAAAKHSSIAKLKLQLPPGPAPLPVLGNLGILLTSRNVPRDLIALARKHGPVMWLKLGRRGAIVVSSADQANAVLRTQGMAFASRPSTYSIATLSIDHMDVAVAPHGPHYIQQRRVLVTELLQPKLQPGTEEERGVEVAAMIEGVRRHILKAQPGKKADPVCLALLLRIMTLNNIMRLSTSKPRVSYDNIVDVAGFNNPTQQSEECTFYRTMEEFTIYFNYPMLGDYVPWLSFVDRLLGSKAKVLNLRKRFDAFQQKIMAENAHRSTSDSQGGSRNFLDVLTGLNTPSIVIQGHLLDLLVGGTDTTVTTLVWAFTELLRRPAVYRRAQEEVLAAVGTDRAVAESDFANLPYISGVVKETLRMYPALPLLLPHLAMEETEVAGYRVPAGTTVLVNALAVGRDPAAWPRPEEFEPERWVDGGSGGVTGVGCLGLDAVPFGAGRRSCPGADLALRLMLLTVARMLQSFHWSLPDEAPEVDLLEKPGTFLDRLHPLWVVPSFL